MLRSVRASTNAPSSAPISASATSRARDALSPRRREIGATSVDPALEDRGGGFAEFLDRVGDLGGDAGHRAHVREPGACHVLGRLGEDGFDGVAEVVVLVDDRGHEQRVGVARIDQAPRVRSAPCRRGSGDTASRSARRRPVRCPSCRPHRSPCAASAPPRRSESTPWWTLPFSPPRYRLEHTF